MTRRGTAAPLRGVLGLLVVTLLGVTPVVAGCAVGQPSASSWSSTASRSLEDAASAVAVARLALRESGEGRIWTSYASNLQADAEEQIGTATNSVATLQRPSEVAESEETAVLDLLSRAEDVVRAARQVTVADRDRSEETAELRKRLARIHRDLLKEAAVVR